MLFVNVVDAPKCGNIEFNASRCGSYGFDILGNEDARWSSGIRTLSYRVIGAGAQNSQSPMDAHGGRWSIQHAVADIGSAGQYWPLL